jgi:trans-aconitate methyltransferase
MQHCQVLESQGFKVEHISLNPRMTSVDTDLYGWLYTFARSSWLADMSEEEAQKIMKEVVRRCEYDMKADGKWALMYVRLRFVAILEA